MCKKLTAILLSIALLIVPVYCVFAEEDAAPPAEENTQSQQPAAAPVPEVTGKGIVLMDATTGEMIYGYQENEPLEPASVTKIMTMALVLEQVEQGNLKYDDIVTASENARAMGGSEIFLDTGEQMTVYDLMMAVAVASANDAAVALGEHLANGSEAAFVEMMNAKAAELGMVNTHFVNPCGLHEEGHITTAYDVALMSRYLLSFESAQEFLTMNLYPIREGEREYKMRNSNELVRSYEGCMGIKTGFTNEAGYCLSAAAGREGEVFISVILGAESALQRNADTISLLDYAFANYQTYEVVPTAVTAQPVPVKLGMEDEVEVVVPEINIGKRVIVKGSTPVISQQVELEESVKAPVTAGQKLGTVTVFMDGEQLNSFDLTAKNDVGKRTFWKAFLILLQKVIGL